MFWQLLHVIIGMCFFYVCSQKVDQQQQQLKSKLHSTHAEFIMETNYPLLLCLVEIKSEYILYDSGI